MPSIKPLKVLSRNLWKPPVVNQTVWNLSGVLYQKYSESDGCIRQWTVSMHFTNQFCFHSQMKRWGSTYLGRCKGKRLSCARRRYSHRTLLSDDRYGCLRTASPGHLSALFYIFSMCAEASRWASPLSKEPYWKSIKHSCFTSSRESKKARCPLRDNCGNSVTFVLTAVAGIVRLSSSDRMNSTCSCPQSHGVISEHLSYVYTNELYRHFTVLFMCACDLQTKIIVCQLCRTFILMVAESAGEMQVCQFLDTLAYWFSPQQFFLYTVLCRRCGTFCFVAWDFLKSMVLSLQINRQAD
jgi:hypothetical protein